MFSFRCALKSDVVENGRVEESVFSIRDRQGQTDILFVIVNRA